jgi:hypothetical protein
MPSLYGWIIDFRRTASFFPVDQLLTHGEWILKIVDNITLPEDADPRPARQGRQRPALPEFDNHGSRGS